MNIKAFILVLTQTGQDEVALKKKSNMCHKMTIAIIHLDT